MTRPITLEFGADEKPITQAFRNISAAADAASTNLREVDSSSKKASDGFDRLAEGSDTAETRFTGFYDTIGGTRDALAAWNDESLSTTDRLVALGQAGADLAGGLVGFVIPALQGVWTKLIGTTAAQWALTAAQTAWNAIATAGTAIMHGLNAAFRANPILFVVGLITVLYIAFKMLWDRSAGFRNFFIGMWNTIKSVVGTVVTWIRNAWNGLMDFFSKLPGRILGFFRALGSGISSIFKGAVNAVIDLLNGGIGLINGLIHGINNVSGVVGIPAIPDIPRIPRLHTGGYVDGPLGSEQLAILQAGERVIPRGQSGNSGATITFGDNVDSAFATAFMKLVRSGEIQIRTV